MALVIPNIENITNGSTGLDFQSVEDKTDNDAISGALAGTNYVVAGMQVTQDTGSDMKIAVAAGKYVVNGVEHVYAGTGGSPITVSAASATDRRDIVTIDNTGTVTVTAGTACGTAGWTRTSTNLPPVKPPIPANNCLLGEVGVTSSTTVITTAINVVDKTTVVGPSTGVGTPNTSAQSLTASAANLITGTKLQLGTGQIVVGTRYRFIVGASKTGAGIASWSVQVKYGTAGTTSDANVASWTSGTNTGVIDEAIIIIEATCTAVGSGTSATWYCWTRLGWEAWPCRVPPQLLPGLIRRPPTPSFMLI